MYKHILLPTDGSALSESAIASGVELAKTLGASVTGFHVIAPYHALTGEMDMLIDTKAGYQKAAQVRSEKYLASLSAIAKQAGVTCDCISEESARPYEAIIAAAGKRDCDLIVMASHGRSGVRALLLGSETIKVLTHSKIPVLVLR
jgi:nucleotide-binding universal stress UspA family protein